MKNMKRYIAALLALVMCLCLFAGCAKTQGEATGEQTQTDANGAENTNASAEATAASADSDTITVLVQAEPPTLDPPCSNTDNTHLVLRYICDKLFELNEDGTYNNVLCESYKYLDDMTVRIKLKSGILFSDGTPLTAEDVLFQYVRASQEAVSASQYAFIDTENSYVEDDTTLVLHFTQAWAPWINTLAGGRASIVSKKAFEEMGADAFARAPVGTGPYKIVEWVSGSYIRLEANEYYWQGVPEVKNIIIKFVEESNSRVIELETGSADIAYYIEGSDIDRVNSIPGYHIEMGDSYRYFIVTYSMQNEYTRNETLRKALTTAIDRDLLVEVCSDGVGTVIDSYSPPLIKDDYVPEPDYTYDVEKAKQLLAEAGYPDGLTIELHVEPQAVMKRLAETIQGMWQEIGVTTNIVTSALATYTAENDGHFCVCIRDGSAQEISNVWTIYESTFGSRLEGNDDWLDAKLLEERTYYPGDERRAACTKEIADYLYEKCYSYPLMVMPTVYAVSDRIENFVFHPNQNNLDVNNWIKK